MYDSAKDRKNQKLPNKQKFALRFVLLSRISYWIHIILGTISGITLLLVFMSDATTSGGAGIGIFIGAFSLVALIFRIYWAYRYRQSAKKLQRLNSSSQPSRTEIITILRVGLISSLTGLFISFVAAEISLVSLVADAISRPQGVAVYEREHIITSADLFLVLAQLNILGAHFFGSSNSLGLLNWLSKEEI